MDKQGAQLTVSDMSDRGPQFLFPSSKATEVVLVLAAHTSLGKAVIEVIAETWVIFRSMSLPQLKSKFQIVHYALTASRSPHARSLAGQLLGALRLRFARNRLGVSEYYDYKLYDRERFSDAAAATFVGARVDGPLMNAVNSIDWRALDEDKLLFSMLLHRVGIRHPKLLAFYWDQFRLTDDAVSLSDARELARFMRDGLTYPCFSKPVDGYRSRGVKAILAYESRSDELLLSNGERLPVDQFIAELPKPWSSGGNRVFRGHMFQELLLPSAEVLSLVEATGLSTIRLVMLCDLPRPELFRAIWKIPREGNMADNFWRPGNLLADVDIATGRIRRVIRSTPNGFEELATESAAGGTLVGRRVPQWDAAVQLCERAAGLLPGTRCQHWDVAICDGGPVVIELNGLGDLSLLQSPASIGVLDARFESFLARVGVNWDWRGIEKVKR